MQYTYISKWLVLQIEGIVYKSLNFQLLLLD